MIPKKYIYPLIIVLCMLVGFVGCGEPEVMTYNNPIIEGADPYILTYDGVYYLYSTNDAANGYILYSSEDMVDWLYRGYCLTKGDVIGNGDFWAPEVIYHNGKFYMIYTSDGCLGVAVADSPLGPFKQEERKWLIENAIDGHFFLDDDGQMYIYYVTTNRGGNQIWAAPINDALTEVDQSRETFLIRAELKHELYTNWSGEIDGQEAICGITEGPAMLKHKDKYYLTYSANGFGEPHYSVCCAVSDSPLGLFEKYDEPILTMVEGKVQGVGHHSFTTAKDGETLFCVYHCHKSLTEIHTRQICIDKAEFVRDKNGGPDILKIYGPTVDEQTITLK